jgi:hypothetical protein
MLEFLGFEFGYGYFKAMAAFILNTHVGSFPDEFIGLEKYFFRSSFRSPSPTESAFEDARSEPDDLIRVYKSEPDSMRIRKEIFQQATDAIDFSARS